MAEHTPDKTDTDLGDELRDILSGDEDRNESDPESTTPGGRSQQKVEDRPHVSQVTPEDYPLAERAGSQ